MSAAILQLRVCDTCHSRKVRCDRDDPCGNCQDQNVPCTRTRGMRRLPKRNYAEMQRSSSEEEVVERHAVQRVPASHGLLGPLTGLLEPPTESSILSILPYKTGEGLSLDIPLVGPSLFLEHLDLNYQLRSWMSFVPLTDAQMVSQPRSEHSQDLAWNRRQALESALVVASQLSGTMAERAESSEVTLSHEEQRTIPSLEFLYWMMKDIGSDKFGAFVQDYFRHIGKSTLKHMGLSILFKTATPSDSILYTVCVNSVAYKFLKTILETETDEELADGLRESALRYRETAQTALKQIPLLSKPSLSLLQATLCGIFLHQGSGDANICWELAKTACRICMDIGVGTTTDGLQKATEEEYYCFMWCYILDRNYAWKLGRPRYLVVDPDIDIGPCVSNAAASELILIYLDLAQVQDRMVPFLNNHSNTDRVIPTNFHDVGADLLRRMERIRNDIHQITLPSPAWKGLDLHSEIAALDFAFHSIMTTIFHLHQVTPGQPQSPTTSADHYLGSARQELLALISICVSNNTPNTVAYLHWTLLYYPLTACFALFCNAVATCHTGDFQILNAVANCLANTGSTSQSIATMQNLFQQFVALSRCFFSDTVDLSGEGVAETVTTPPAPSSPVPRGSPLLPSWTGAVFEPGFAALDGGLYPDIV